MGCQRQPFQTALVARHRLGARLLKDSPLVIALRYSAVRYQPVSMRGPGSGLVQDETRCLADKSEDCKIPTGSVAHEIVLSDDSRHLDQMIEASLFANQHQRVAFAGESENRPRW